MTLPIVSGSGVGEIECPLGVALISQTCDIVQTNRPNVIVARVARLDPSEAKSAIRGERPRYAHLPAASTPDLFADLEFCATLAKSELSRDSLWESGVDDGDPKMVRQFAARIGRRFSRFPFPDDIQPSFRPLQEKVRSGHHKEESPLGRALQLAKDIRIEADSWEKRPINLTIHVILPGDAIPSPEAIDYAEEPQELGQWLHPRSGERRTASEIAERLLGSSTKPASTPTAVERYYLWQAFADALARLCRTRNSAKPCESVAAVVGQIWTEDEFSLRRYRSSESLDLEDLSGLGA